MADKDTSAQRLKLLYLRDIFQKFTSETEALTRNQITDILSDYGITEGRKAFSEDVEALQKYGMDIRMTMGRTKHVVVQAAPAVRAALGEAFGLPIGTDVEGKMAAALRRLGFDKVFDTNFSADLTIMEEAHEFLDRVKNGGKLPLITSCSPGWVKYCEHYFPDMTENLSSCKSPQQMFGAIVKSYYAEKEGIDPKDIVSVSIMPSSISISRAEGLWVISAAFAIRSSVVSPCADTTTTTSLPALWVLATMRATLKIRFRSFTEEPPNFCTINAIVCHSPLVSPNLYHSTVAPVLSASSSNSVNASHPSRPSSVSSPARSPA